MAAGARMSSHSKNSKFSTDLLHQPGAFTHDSVQRTISSAPFINHRSRHQRAGHARHRTRARQPKNSRWLLGHCSRPAVLCFKPVLGNRFTETEISERLSVSIWLVSLELRSTDAVQVAQWDEAFHHTLAAAVRHSMADVRAAVSHIEHSRGEVRGTVRIGCAESAGTDLMHASIAHYRQTHPAVQFAMASGITAHLVSSLLQTALILSTWN